MNELEQFVEDINRANAEQAAEKVKEYCKMRKECNGCVFFIGMCKLVQHPCDWDFRRRV